MGVAALRAPVGGSFEFFKSMTNIYIFSMTKISLY